MDDCKNLFLVKISFTTSNQVQNNLKAQLHEMEMEKTECLQQGENLKTKERIGFIFVTWKQSLCFILTVRKKQVKVMITFNAAHFMPVYF